MSEMLIDILNKRSQRRELQKRVGRVFNKYVNRTRNVTEELFETHGAPQLVLNFPHSFDFRTLLYYPDVSDITSRIDVPTMEITINGMGIMIGIVKYNEIFGIPYPVKEITIATPSHELGHWAYFTRHPEIREFVQMGEAFHPLHYIWFRCYLEAIAFYNESRCLESCGLHRIKDDENIREKFYRLAEPTIRKNMSLGNMDYVFAIIQSYFGNRFYYKHLARLQPSEFREYLTNWDFTQPNLYELKEIMGLIRSSDISLY